MTTSEIRSHFQGTTVFVTGATGFLGKLVVEKLLRTCDVKKIYILIRPKRIKTVEERFQEYFNGPEFGLLKKEKPGEYAAKLAVIAGDCALPNLGLTDPDRALLISEINCILHCAATVRFDEKLKLACYINVRATSDLLKLAKGARNLKSIVHVSTAYSFCPRTKIDEAFYPPALKPSQLVSLVEILKEEDLESLVPRLLGGWPNTYTFTKSIAEDVVRTEGAGLPIAVVRPSIVLGPLREPLPGWSDNFSGPAGLYLSMVLGFIHTMLFEPSTIADQVPADYVINAMLAAACDVGGRSNGKTLGTSTSTMEPKVFNYVSGARNPLTWRANMDHSNQVFEEVPSMQQAWHSFVFMNRSKRLNLVLHYLLHIFPAYLADFFCICVGKKARIVRLYRKFEKVMDVLAYFTTRQWDFKDTNTQKLWEKLNDEDRKLFYFDITDIDWMEVAKVEIPGMRVHLLKDPLDTVPRAITKRFRLKIIHYFLCVMLILAFIKVLLYFF